jgi:alkylation response protein AidB-like acyl-CoA dehydrogenase
VDPELDDEQRELQRVARDLVDKECPPALVRAVVEGRGDGDELWQTLVGLEWPGLTVPVEQGGSGATFVELAILLEELGHGGDPTPFLATTSQHLPLVRSCLAGAARDARIEAIAGGSPGAAVLDEGAVSARLDGDAWVLQGTAAHVLDAARADALAVVATTPDGPGVLLVPRADAVVTPEASFDPALRLATVQLDGVRVPVDHAGTGPEVAAAIDRARQEAVTGLAAVMVGASQRVFDLVLDHIRHRHQFGVPIGSFQAVKHMAVDVYTAIERARAVTRFAALAIAEDDDRRALAASVAKAAAGDAQRIASEHGVQLFGGLGYTWENDLHLYLRRAKAGEALLGTAHEHRVAASGLVLAALADEDQDPDDLALRMELDEATAAFRQELVDWLDANQPAPEETTERSRSSAHVPEWARTWQRKMFDAGWLIPGNPPEFGGRNATLMEQLVHHEELSRRRIYLSFNPQGVSIVTPSILAFGTDEQKEQWARRILRAEITAALGMSEPDAGSDLAGLRTRAVLDGDRFVVNGQKVWTSGAHDADVILAFVRTDPDAPKHKGISCLLIPTDSPGLTRRPFGAIQGPEVQDFNEVFFDDVEVPAENLVGPLNEGWRVATGSLGHERAMLWLGYAERLEDLVTHGGRVLLDQGLEADGYALDWFGRLVTDSHALRLLGYRTLAEVQRGVVPAAQSILKLLGSEAVQRATLHVLEALGPDGLDPTVRSAPYEPLNLDEWADGWFDLYLRTFSMTIAGGTSQIQRNIVAEHVLGLPR